MDDSREEKLRELQQFLEQSDQQLNNITSLLGWSRKSLQKSEASDTMVCCMYEKNHKVSQSKLMEHEENCKLQQMGYDKNDISKMQSSKYCYENTSVFSMNIDAKLQHEILQKAKTTPGVNFKGEAVRSQIKEVPQTFERCQSDFTREERLAIYNYCIDSAKTAEKLVQISDEDLMFLSEEDNNLQAKGSKSYLEMLAEMRDYKRRRQSYRAKNVHTTKKSHTEVIRDVINSQMETLSKIIEDDNEEKDRETKKSGEIRLQKKSRSPSHRSRSSSRSDHYSSNYASHHSSRGSSPRDRKKRHRSRTRSRSHNRKDDKSRRKHSKKHKHDRDKKSPKGH